MAIWSAVIGFHQAYRRADRKHPQRTLQGQGQDPNKRNVKNPWVEVEVPGSRYKAL